MKKILLAVSAVVIVGIIMTSTNLDSFDSHLEISDYEIIHSPSMPLFLSVTTSGSIPEKITDDGFGYGWLKQDSEKLVGYISNIHDSSGWHTESIIMNDSEQFCFDGIKNVISNVKVNENKITAVIEQYDISEFDIVISYRIESDSSCNTGFAGIITDKINTE